MKTQEINLKIGVGDLAFSMTEQDIIQQLGQPDAIDNDNINDCLVYYYDTLGLAVVFVEIEGQRVIESLELENACYQLWQTSIFNQSFDDIIALFKQKNISNFEQNKNAYATFIIYQNLFINFDSDTHNVTDFSLSNPSLASLR